ncbi:flavodoxin family protein [Desulfopila inferna]|uniref:flavodoxin family protein n=1 Tax=Desulfopila inferna TaxID=468528 RepID=UPI001962E007|nr:flavodoxin family protein [Desulfopila inferna]MBM9604941.1 flavodoxin family protein [Desulfopila inferna]
MNILAVLGSPRKNGNSQTLVQTVISGIEEKIQCRTEYIYLQGMKSLSPCIGCGGCEKTGMCVIKDDMIELYGKADTADIIFLVTPVYFYGPTSQLKAFIDRFQARWSRKYLLNERVRIEDKRRGYLLATAATKGPKVFEGCVLVAKSYFDTIDVPYSGELLIRGVDEKKAFKNNTEETENALRFGREIADSFG